LYVDLSFVLLLFCFSAICFQPFDAWKRHLSSFWGHRSVAKRVTLLCGKGQESREASPSFDFGYESTRVCKYIFTVSFDLLHIHIPRHISPLHIHKSLAISLPDSRQPDPFALFSSR